MSIATYIDKLNNHIDETVSLSGWVQGLRPSGKVIFLTLRDGTGLCQCIIEKRTISEESFNAAKHLGQESTLTIEGGVRKETRSTGGVEISVSKLSIFHKTENYPITPKKHGDEFLFKHRHLHLRSQRQWAIARIRHTVIDAIRTYFNDLDFTLVDSPIISNAAGEDEQTLFSLNYFDRNAALSQTGQMHLECSALSLGKVYCFGPTFRAEKSKTRRHLTEFWMVEPEVAWITFPELLNLGEKMIHKIISDVLQKRSDELTILGRDKEKLKRCLEPFPQLSYSQAVDLLHSDKVEAKLMQDLAEKNAMVDTLNNEIQTAKADLPNARKQWQKDKLANQIQETTEQINELTVQIKNIPDHLALAKNFQWGKDLGGSDETIISSMYDTPVYIHRYPKDVKAFYMLPDPEDQRVVLNMDCLAPEGYGEIIGGSMREHDHDDLLARINEKGYRQENYQWFLDLRKYGSVPHGGFGLGLERTVAWMCGIKHVRETIAFPRLTQSNLSP